MCASLDWLPSLVGGVLAFLDFCLVCIDCDGLSATSSGSAASHRVFACIEPAIRRAFPTSIESAFA